MNVYVANYNSKNYKNNCSYYIHRPVNSFRSRYASGVPLPTQTQKSLLDSHANAVKPGQCFKELPQ